ncbi:MAG: hypothetical protein AAF297_02510 [Planctomycetota bacterium]
MHATRTLLALAAALTPVAAQAQTTNPAGLYYHTFTGAIDATEWSTWGALPGENRYEFADIPAVGVYPSTHNPDGSFTFDGGIGQGAFRPDGSASMNFDFGGGVRFQSEIRRAPYTDEHFPVFRESPVPGDRELAGEWTARILDVDPATGDTIEASTGQARVLVASSVVRVILPDGDFYQATWISDDQAAMRVIQAASDPDYATFPGSATNVGQNVVGELRVAGPNAMTLTAFRQTIAPLGSQIQTMRYIELTRVPAPGALAPLALASLIAVRRRR